MEKTCKMDERTIYLLLPRSVCLCWQEAEEMGRERMQDIYDMYIQYLSFAHVVEK